MKLNPIEHAKIWRHCKLELEARSMLYQRRPQYWKAHLPKYIAKTSVAQNPEFRLKRSQTSRNVWIERIWKHIRSDHIISYQYLSKSYKAWTPVMKDGQVTTCGCVFVCVTEYELARASSITCDFNLKFKWWGARSCVCGSPARASWKASREKLISRRLQRTANVRNLQYPPKKS